VKADEHAELYSNNGEVIETIISFDVVIFEEIEELADNATHIIRGEVLDKVVKWMDLNLSREEHEYRMVEQGLSEEEIEANIYSVREDGTADELEIELVTITRVLVLEVFQGNHEVGDIIEIMQSGGEYGNERWIVEGSVDLEIGSELVLFLVSWEFAGLPYSLTSIIQSVYYIPHEIEHDNNIIEFNNCEVVLESANEANPIEVSVGDLIEIAEENDLLD